MRRLVPALLALAAAALALPGAHAQSNALTGSPNSYTTISGEQMIRMLREEGMTVEAVPGPGGKPIILASFAGESPFLVVLRDCADEFALQGCRLIEPSVLFALAQPDLAAFNRFHLSQSQLATAMWAEDGTAIVASKVYLVGGIGADNILAQIAMTLMDADTAVSTFGSATLASAGTFPQILPPSAKVTEAMQGRIDAMKALAADGTLEAVFGAAGISDTAPSFLPTAVRLRMIADR